MVRKSSIFVAFLVISFFGLAKEVPRPNTGGNGVRAFVKDVADVLTEQEEITLCNKLKAFYDSTSNEVVIFLDDRVGEDETPFDYSLKIGREWGVGGSEFNNGIVIYAAITDRKVFIQVGYGLEGAIPDIYANRIIEEVIVPNFRSVGYYQGLDQAIDRIIQYSRGEYTNDGSGQKKKMPAWLIVVIIIIILIVLSSFGGNSGTTYRGRGGGWIIGPGMGGGFGGGGFGGSGGGGFGGFGGGSFGGGGAGGSW